MNNQEHELLRGIINYHNLEFHPNRYGPSNDGDSIRQGVAIWQGTRRLGSIIFDPTTKSIEDTVHGNPAFDIVKQKIIEQLRKTGNAYALGSVFFR